MGHDESNPGSSVGTFVAILAVLLVLFGALAIAAVGAAFFIRTSRMAQVARFEQLRAEEARAVALAAQREAAAQRDRAAGSKLEEEPLERGSPSPANEPLLPAAPGSIRIHLDATGRIEANGESVVLEDLLSWLKRRTTSQTDAASVSVTVRAHRRCLFEHVANVLAVCDGAGISNVHVRALEPAIERPTDRGDDFRRGPGRHIEPG